MGGSCGRHDAGSPWSWHNHLAVRFVRPHIAGEDHQLGEVRLRTGQLPRRTGRVRRIVPCIQRLLRHGWKMRKLSSPLSKPHLQLTKISCLAGEYQLGRVQHRRRFRTLTRTSMGRPDAHSIRPRAMEIRMVGND